MFKDDLCAAMEHENVTVKWLGEYFNVSDKTVCNWRAGKSLPRKSIMIDICRLFDLPMDSYKGEVPVSKNETRKRIDFIFDNNKLKELRTRRNWSQAQLADMLGLSSSTIGNWETSVYEPSLSALRELCAIFGVREEYFKKGDKNTKKNDVVEKEGVKVNENNWDDDVLKPIDNRFDAMYELINKLQERVDGINVILSDLENKVVSYDSVCEKTDRRLDELASVVNDLCTDVSSAKNMANKSIDSNGALIEAIKALSFVITSTNTGERNTYLMGSYKRMTPKGGQS